MGNNNMCTCLKKQTAEEQRFEYVVFTSEKSAVSPRNVLKVQYSKYALDNSEINQNFNDCSFTRKTEANSNSINAFNADADQLSFIEKRISGMSVHFK